MQEYRVSKKEIIRREKAFFSLSIFFISGLILASIIFKVQISVWFYVGFLLILVLSNLLILIFFKSLLRMKINLSRTLLIRKRNLISEKFLVKNIKKIKIKRTTRKSVREVSLFLNNGQSLLINGLDNFEKFMNNLLKMVRKETIIKNISEPIDFDSIFFYPILGLILSFGTIYFLKVLSGLSYSTIKIISDISLIYVFLVLIYFIFSKPISKRYGRNKIIN